MNFLAAVKGQVFTQAHTQTRVFLNPKRLSCTVIIYVYVSIKAISNLFLMFGFPDSFSLVSHLTI